MKLKCKCGNVLTKDLYPVKSFSYEVAQREWVGQTEEDEVEYEKNHFTKEGTIIVRNMYIYFDPPIDHYTINRDDGIGITFTPYKDGYGCCDNNGIPIKCNKCDVTLGWEYYDCYDAKGALIVKNKVDRTYK